MRPALWIGRLVIVVCATLSMIVAAALAQSTPATRGGMTIAAVLSLVRPSSVSISPDGELVAFVATWPSIDQDRDEAKLVIVSSHGTAPGRTVAVATHISNVQWMPDSRQLVYVAEAAVQSRIWLASADGHARRLLTGGSKMLARMWEDTQLDTYSPYELSADGKSMVYAVYDTLAARRDLVAGARGGVVYRGSSVGALTDPRHWPLTFEPLRFELHRTWLKGGSDRVLWSTVVKTHGAWDPEFKLFADGSRLVLNYPVEDSTTRFVVATLDLRTLALRPIRQLLWARGLRWDERDRSLSLEAIASRDTNVYAMYSLQLDSGVLRKQNAALTADSPVSRRISDLVQRETGKLVAGCSIDRRGDRAACVAEAPSIAPDVVTVELRSPKPAIHQVTRLNPQIDRIALGHVIELELPTPAGRASAGVVLPVGYQEERRYPVVVMMYQLYDGRHFIADAPGFTSYPAEPFAAHGYVVVLMNPPSGDHDYPPGDFEKAKAAEADGMAIAVRAAIDSLVTRGIADTSRMGLMGWSLGGFWAGYIVSQHPTWFRAAAAGDDGAHDVTGYWLGDDNYRRHEDGFYGGGPYGPLHERWRMVSPVLNAGRIRAPLLIEASEGYLWGLEMRSAVVGSGGQADLVLYPDDVHVFFKPLNRFKSMTRHYDWFNFWLLGEEANDPSKRNQYDRWRAMRRALEAAPESERSLEAKPHLPS